MLSRFVLFFSIAAVLCGQPVVSVRAGLVHFFEGSVSIDGQQLEQRFGRFYDIKLGSGLRTDQGRAEVLLTPGVFLRVDENSSVRMLANGLSNTRVEFIGGSASVDARTPTVSSVTIAYKDFEIRFKEQGRYRFNSTPAELRVDQGAAEVVFRNQSTPVASNQVLAFTAPLLARFIDQPAEDAFDRWSQDRNDLIAAADASAAASDNLTSALNDPQAPAYDFGAYPVTTSGVLVPGGALSPYSLYPGSLYPYNYLPFYRPGIIGGYLYRPLPPIRTGIYAPGGAFQPRPRMSAPATMPSYRSPATSPSGSHPAGRVGHR